MRRTSIVQIAAGLIASTATAGAQPASAAQAPTVHRVVADTFWNTLDHRHPVVRRIRPGDIVVTKTIDASGYDDHEKQRAASGNPMVGPFYIEGAEPGDALVVHFRRIRLNRTTAWSYWRLGVFALTPDAVERLYPNSYKPDLVRPGRANLLWWDVDTAKATVRLREPKSDAIRLEFPALPMLGVVGVAPAGDFAPTSGPSREYGGNMDFNEIREGATLYLPVFHPGALLFLADGHALMADGEPTGAGLETSMDVEFSTELKKGARLTMPRVENRDYIIAVGSQAEFISPLDRGLQLATTDMVRWLTEVYKLEPWAAHLLVNAVGEYEVVTVAGSMALKVPKRYLPAPR
jgi:acetamidase/formamidase